MNVVTFCHAWVSLPKVKEQNFAVARSAAHQERQGPLWYLEEKPAPLSPSMLSM